MLYVELDGNANGEGAAFERKNIRASTVTRGDPPEGETQGSDATGFLRATPDLHTQGTDASGFLPSPGGGGSRRLRLARERRDAARPTRRRRRRERRARWATRRSSKTRPRGLSSAIMAPVPEGDETQLEAGAGEHPRDAEPLATLTQLEPVAEEEEPDGTEIEENDETQLEAPPPPPPNDDDDELRFEEADDDDDNSEAAPDAETQLDAERLLEALPPPVAPEHASPSVLDGAARIAQAQAPDLASPAPRRRGSQSNEGPPSAPGKGAARELFSFEDDQAEAPAPAPPTTRGPSPTTARPTASSRSPRARKRSSRRRRPRNCASAAAPWTRRRARRFM